MPASQIAEGGCERSRLCVHALCALVLVVLRVAAVCLSSDPKLGRTPEKRLRDASRRVVLLQLSLSVCVCVSSNPPPSPLPRAIKGRSRRRGKRRGKEKKPVGPNSIQSERSQNIPTQYTCVPALAITITAPSALRALLLVLLVLLVLLLLPPLLVGLPPSSGRSRGRAGSGASCRRATWCPAGGSHMVKKGWEKLFLMPQLWWWTSW